MVPRGRQKRTAALHEKLQLLRSITNSHAENDTSIIVDASKYIEELKQKVEGLNQDIATSARDVASDSPVKVTVERVKRGFKIKAYSEKSCAGLLVTVLEAFEQLGLTVEEARVSCTDSFQLQAVGRQEEEEEEESAIDARVVKRTVLQAINSWTANHDHP